MLTRRTLLLACCITLGATLIVAEGFAQPTSTGTGRPRTRWSRTGNFWWRFQRDDECGTSSFRTGAKRIEAH